MSGNAHGAEEHEIATEVSAPQCAIRLASSSDHASRLPAWELADPSCWRSRSCSHRLCSRATTPPLEAGGPRRRKPRAPHNCPWLGRPKLLSQLPHPASPPGLPGRRCRSVCWRPTRRSRAANSPARSPTVRLDWRRSRAMPWALLLAAKPCSQSRVGWRETGEKGTCESARTRCDGV